MSSVASTFQTMVQDFINAAATVLDQIAVTLSNYAPVIAGVVIAVATGYIGFRLLERTPILRRVVGWLTQLF